MKKLIGLFSLTLLITAVSCSKTAEQNQDLNLNNVELELSDDFSITKMTYDLNLGLDQFVKDLYTYIDAQDEGTTEKIEFRFDAENNRLLVNQVLKSKTNGEPCPPESDTCYSAACVQETLSMILGEGDRDVNIEYRRNALSVTITWTYLDC